MEEVRGGSSIGNDDQGDLPNADIDTFPYQDH